MTRAFAMGDANPMRLKIWGRARVISPSQEDELLRRLIVPEYPARVERGSVVAAESFDWNCPRHITLRFTEEEVKVAVAPTNEELHALRERVKGSP